MKRSTARETSLYGATAPMTTRAHTPLCVARWLTESVSTHDGNTPALMRDHVARREWLGGRG